MDQSPQTNTDALMGIMLANKSKNFVDRVLNRDKYPVLNNPDGTVSTHKMSWGESNGKYYVYPTILWNGKKLIDYGENAFPKAMQSGDFIEFDSPDKADWFSKNYKKIWGSQ